MSLYVIHMRFTRRKILLAAAALVLVTGMALLLAGCFRSAAPREAVTLATNEQRVATMDLQLPEDLKAQWGDYLKLQTQQGMPMADCAGQVVRRFTYTVTNYPDVPDGVQVNLFTCGDRLVGGDIIATGENGFQTGLTFPEK